MTNAENNRRIAELLGWIREDYSCSRIDCTPTRSHEGYRTANGYRGGLVDFYTDEAANAMLLDAMPRPGLYRLDDSTWVCRYSEWTGDQKGADRKSAICAAFIAWKESEGK